MALLRSPSTTRIALPALICIAALAFWLLLPESTENSRIEVRFTNLQDMLGSQQALYKKATNDYIPKVQGRVDDLAVPAAEILRHLPGVTNVDQPLKPRKVSDRLIHLRDWHYVTKEWFAKDIWPATGKPLTDTDVDLRYQEFLLQVELVQIEQMATLRCLIKYHGLSRVFIERFTAEQVPAFNEKIAALREAEPHQPELRKQHKEAQALVGQLAADRKQATERFTNAQAIEKEIAGMLEQHRFALLEIGAAGRLLVSGELENVLPLDDAALLDAAAPVTANGKMTFDVARVAARLDAMVKLALANDHAAVTVLGGSHDLTDNVRGIVGDGCEYIRVTGHAFRKYSGEARK